MPRLAVSSHNCQHRELLIRHLVDGHTCQKALIYMSKNYHRVRLQQVVTIGAKYSLVADGKGVLATDNLAIAAHPAVSCGGTINAWRTQLLTSRLVVSNFNL